MLGAPVLTFLMNLLHLLNCFLIVGKAADTHRIRNGIGRKSGGIEFLVLLLHEENTLLLRSIRTDRLRSVYTVFVILKMNKADVSLSDILRARKWQRILRILIRQKLQHRLCDRMQKKPSHIGKGRSKIIHAEEKSDDLPPLYSSSRFASSFSHL